MGIVRFSRLCNQIRRVLPQEKKAGKVIYDPLAFFQLEMLIPMMFIENIILLQKVQKFSIACA